MLSSASGFPFDSDKQYLFLAAHRFCGQLFLIECECRKSCQIHVACGSVTFCVYVVRHLICIHTREFRIKAKLLHQFRVYYYYCYNLISLDDRRREQTPPRWPFSLFRAAAHAIHASCCTLSVSVSFSFGESGHVNRLPLYTPMPTETDNNSAKVFRVNLVARRRKTIWESCKIYVADSEQNLFFFIFSVLLRWLWAAIVNTIVWEEPIQNVEPTRRSWTDNGSTFNIVGLHELKC